ASNTQELPVGGSPAPGASSQAPGWRAATFHPTAQLASPRARLHSIAGMPRVHMPDSNDSPASPGSDVQRSVVRQRRGELRPTSNTRPREYYARRALPSDPPQLSSIPAPLPRASQI